MGSTGVDDKPHAVFMPFPVQGHINAMMRLAKVLHYRGFHVTFVLTDYNHKRLIKSRGPNSCDGLPDFCFETIPDGLPPSDYADATQDIQSLCVSIPKTCLLPFCILLSKLNGSSSSNVPPVTCIVGDGCMTFTLKAAEEFGIPGVIFWSTSACGVMGFKHFIHLVERGLIPLKDESYLTNGYLDTTIDWIPGMKNIRLRDIPSFIRTTDSKDIILNFLIKELEALDKASAIIINTFDALEQEVLDALSAMYPRVYSVGPLHSMVNQISDQTMRSIGSNLWKEELECIKWLDSKQTNSVVYVNFGSIAVMTPHQLTEFAWGLANSQKPFLWITRPDLVTGENAILPALFLHDTKERGMLASWCPQEQVLNHASVGGFLTHSGWNSTIESISGGVPVICWPFFAEQQTNCRYSCVEWGIGMEIDSDLMEGGRGKEMKEMTMEWKRKAEVAIGPGGSSQLHLDKLVNEVLLSK
ncbi:7-deoxyloganetin glucosyltransferase-like isoform X1 [Cornus florida]|uniref:7-deoxyloganetin glucosyltransferase-like isoform X1 n=1 Tax=Cornus florida TaxID=4283 RepID=UPI00289B814F|nr:7-deoxyloganetin glucosyltransferase-like isoform X1 [Cornus florida]